jgi:ferredoxin-NADP reductase
MRDVASPWVELVDPLWTTHVRHARIDSIRTETLTTRTLVLAPGSGWKRHLPGQFVEIGVEVDGRILGRTYSISSSPDRRDKRISITVTAVGRVSRALVYGSRCGDYVRIGLPKGDFTMPEEAPERVLFVTGGSGITPIMSMLRTFESRRAMPDVVHVHYARTKSDVIFAREIAELARAFPSYRPTIIRTEEGSSDWAFGEKTLASLAPDFVTRDAWACGPESLLEAVSTHVPHVRVERFRPKLHASPGACGGRIRFSRSKREADAGAEPILVIAERAGVNAPHGCRMGICHSCDATMLSGSVRDLRTGEIHDEPGTRIQPCVCAAASDVDVDL